MRYYNVYFYSSCPPEQNIGLNPSYWVWKLENCLQNDPVPTDATRMSLSELRAYKQLHKASYNTWVDAMVTVQTLADKKVKKAIKGVNSIINKFCAENIVMGINQANKTKLVADEFKDVIYYAQTGSLYEALSALDLVVITPEMSPFLTEARRTELRDKLLNFLANL